MPFHRIGRVGTGVRAVSKIIESRQSVQDFIGLFEHRCLYNLTCFHTHSHRSSRFIIFASGRDSKFGRKLFNERNTLMHRNIWRIIYSRPLYRWPRPYYGSDTSTARLPTCIFWTYRKRNFCNWTNLSVIK